jgi:hypothetical protein
VRLKELINVSDTTTAPPTAVSLENEVKLEDHADALYRLVRPAHLTLPNSGQRAVALKVLGIYIKRFGSLQSAADALKPYAAEADARGISPTNLCWLSEWAAVGQIPRQRRKARTNKKPADGREEQIDYDAIRRRMESELPPLVAQVSGERSQS